MAVCMVLEWKVEVYKVRECLEVVFGLDGGCVGGGRYGAGVDRGLYGAGVEGGGLYGAGVLGGGL
nr:unnamed protein product [Callosobruchus chinensis]